jgi:hypothetical protein
MNMQKFFNRSASVLLKTKIFSFFALLYFYFFIFAILLRTAELRHTICFFVYFTLSGSEKKVHRDFSGISL